MNQKTYHATVIGLGAIAHGYSMPGDAAPYTHIGGIFRSNRFTLAGASDLFPAAREGFTAKWNHLLPDVPTFDSAVNMIKETKPDCVAVCVRGPFHANVMREILPLQIPVIFLEKPPTCSLAEMDEILDLAAKYGSKIVVSYSRHWAPRVLQATKLIETGIIGDIHSVVAYCGQGILSFASHTTDLICQMASAQNGGRYAPLSVKALGFTPEQNERNAIPDNFAGYEIEPYLTRLELAFENGVSGIQVGPHGPDGAFYADVYGSKGRAKVGIYCGAHFFDAKNEAIEIPELDAPDTGPFAAAYDQIAGFLDGNGTLDCEGENFVAVNEIGFGAIESMAQGGKQIHLPNVARDRKIYANG